MEIKINPNNLDLYIKYWILILWIIVIYIKWLWWRNFPKFKPNEVGIFLVSDIWHSDVLNEIFDKLKSDLQEKLWTETRIITLKSSLHYKEISILHSKIEQRNYEEMDVQNFQNKTNASYIALFQAGYRNMELVEIKNIKQIVFHRPTHERNRNLLRRDLSFILWKNIDIPIKSEREEINKLTSNIAPFIKYIASVIDFIWGKDFKSCRDRLENLLISWLNWMSTENLNTLRLKVNILISTTYQEEINMIIDWFHESGYYPRDRLLELLECSDKGSSYHASYELKLQKGVINFLMDFNTERARKSIKRAQWFAWDDQAWRASLIFLDLFDWRYKEAIEQIKKMKKYTLYQNTGLSILHFNNSLLKTNPEFNILLFWNAVVSKLFLKNWKKYKYYKDIFLAQSNDDELRQFLNDI